MIVRFDRRSFRCCAPFAPMPCIISHLTQVTWRNTYTEFTERNETKWNPDDAILSNVVGKKHMKENHSTVHLPIFFWVGFRWDGHYEPEMGGMDPTCHHPKPRPTNLNSNWATKVRELTMGDRERRHCRWIHSHLIHEWERLRGLGGGRKRWHWRRRNFCGGNGRTHGYKYVCITHLSELIPLPPPFT